MAGIILFGATTVFQLVTLPVEYNASHRAIETIEGAHLLDEEEPGRQKGPQRGGADLCGGAADVYRAVAALYPALCRAQRPGRAQMSGNAREVALEVLTACRKADAWADGALKSALARGVWTAGMRLWPPR